MIRMSLKPGLVAGIALTLAACESETDIGTGPGVTDRSDDPLSEVVADTASISVAASALERTGLDGVLEGEASYTVFAPTDTAFEALGDDAAAMLEDEARGAIVAAILREHMVPGALTPDAIRAAIADNGGEVTLATFGSGDLTLTLDGEAVVVSNAGGQRARLESDPVVGSNGVVIPIDTVLVDPDALAGSSE